MAALELKVAPEQFLISEPKVIQLDPWVVLRLWAIPKSRVRDTHTLHKCLPPNRHHHHEHPHKLL